MNLRDHITEWLDSIGADGLMNDTHGGISVYEKDEIDTALNVYDACQLVPAYRHADGSYHVEKEVLAPCVKCGEQFDCGTLTESTCPQYQSWLAHKGEEK